MTTVKPFTVGPILGNTTAQSFHVFGRGERAKEQKTLSVLRYRAIGIDTWSAPIIRRQQPHFDGSSVTIVNGLSADSRYEYQAGYINEAEDSDELKWDNIAVCQAKTCAEDVAKPLNLVFGSCRYVLKIFGWDLLDDRSDKTYRSIYRDHNSQAIDRVLMLGDQIYADDLNAVAADDSIEDYFKRYRSVFANPHFSELVANVPVCMTLDDHEIEDNWPAHATGKDMVTKYPSAMYAYHIYQMSHSPLALLDDSGQYLKGFPEHFWYRFSDGCCQFFMMDVRTQRHGDEMIDDHQMQALQQFLKQGKAVGRVNVVCTSVPFFPDYQRHNDDKWSGYINQRNRILDFIESHDIQDVVFLSGDVHASLGCTISNGRTRVHSIVSSPFYWPFPHPRKATFQLSGPLAGNARYEVTNPVPQVNTDNYTQLQISPSGIGVKIKGRKGDLLSQGQISFSG